MYQKSRHFNQRSKQRSVGWYCLHRLIEGVQQSEPRPSATQNPGV